MRYSSRFTRSGNGKRSKSGARVRRVMDRANWSERLDKNMRRYEKWEKAMSNIATTDEYGNLRWVESKNLIHKGRKP